MSSQLYTTAALTWGKAPQWPHSTSLGRPQTRYIRLYATDHLTELFLKSTRNGFTTKKNASVKYAYRLKRFQSTPFHT